MIYKDVELANTLVRSAKAGAKQETEAERKENIESAQQKKEFLLEMLCRYKYKNCGKRRNKMVEEFPHLTSIHFRSSGNFALPALISFPLPQLLDDCEALIVDNSNHCGLLSGGEG